MPRVPPDIMENRKAFIMANHKSMTSKEISEALGIFQSQVSQCCEMLGVKCVHDTERMAQFIIDHPELSSHRIAEHFNKSHRGILNFISKQKLRPKKQGLSQRHLKSKLKMVAPTIETTAPINNELKVDDEQIIKYDKRIAEIHTARSSFTSYNQTHSPFGLADELKGIEATKEPQPFYMQIVRL